MKRPLELSPGAYDSLLSPPSFPQTPLFRPSWFQLVPNHIQVVPAGSKPHSGGSRWFQALLSWFQVVANPVELVPGGSKRGSAEFHVIRSAFQVGAGDSK